MAIRRLTAQEKEKEGAEEAEYIEYNADLNYDADTEEALSKLRDAFATTDTKGTMWVYRLPTDEKGEVVGNAKPTMLFNAPLDRYELEELTTTLRAQYMKPGERSIFRVTATARGQQGMKLNRLLILQRENVDSRANENPQRESFAEILRAMHESNAATADRTERMLATFAATARMPTTPPVDAMEQALKMMTVMTGMTQALVSRVTGTPANDPMAAMQQTLAVMKSMKNFLGENGGGGDEDPDSLASILRAAGPIVGTVGELLKRAAPVRAIQGPRRRVMPNPAAGMTPEQLRAQQDMQGVRAMLVQLRAQVEALVKSASEGGDPLAVATLVVDAFEPDSPEERKFVGFLEREDWWKLLAGVYPSAAPHEEWFTKLRNAVLAEFPEDTPPAT